MNKNNMGTLYVPVKDHQLWEESDAVAKALGMSRSELILTLLRKVCNDPEAQVLKSNQSVLIQERAGKILSQLLDSKPAA